MAKLYAGLDVADLTTAVCVVDDTGAIVLETSVATTPPAIAAALKPYRRHLTHVGQETGTKASWLHKELTRLRFKMVCLDARHARAALATKINKSDRNDARGIALLLCRGLFTTAHVKSDEANRIRHLLLTRKSLQRKAIDLQMVLRTSLKSFGASVERKRNKVVIKHASGNRDPLVDRLAMSLVRTSDALLAEVAALDKLVAETAKSDPLCQRFMTIPGVGPITALSFKAGVDDPHRFQDSRTVGAYFGLTPRQFQSGQMDLHGHISRRGDVTVRAALFGAGTALIVSSRSQCGLRQWALRLRERRGFRIAATATARKLAVLMHSMWLSGKEYEPRRAKLKDTL